MVGAALKETDWTVPVILGLLGWGSEAGAIVEL
jgi:hypothetical protein